MSAGSSALFPDRRYADRARFPSFEDLMAERDRLFARHPRIGTTTAATDGDISAVLNVPGVGLVDILENTPDPRDQVPARQRLIAPASSR